MSIAVKRVYDKPAKSDGKRILVDRIWPRPLTKEQAHLDEWIRDIAPSTALRKWFNHEDDKWPEFKKRYFKELAGQKDAVGHLLELARHHHVTLLFGAHNEEHNNAVALGEYLQKKL